MVPDFFFRESQVLDKYEVTVLGGSCCLYHLVSRSLVHGERHTLHVCFLCQKAVMGFKGARRL